VGQLSACLEDKQTGLWLSPCLEIFHWRCCYSSSVHWLMGWKERFSTLLWLQSALPWHRHSCFISISTVFLQDNKNCCFLSIE